MEGFVATFTFYLMVNNDAAIFAIDPPFRGSNGKFSARQQA